MAAFHLLSHLYLLVMISDSPESSREHLVFPVRSGTGGVEGGVNHVEPRVVRERGRWSPTQAPPPRGGGASWGCASRSHMLACVRACVPGACVWTASPCSGLRLCRDPAPSAFDEETWQLG